MNLSRRRLRPALVLPTESTDPVLFARARPRVVRLEERYRCRQTVAPNSTLVWDPEDRASGTVEIVTPYDGYEHVTRDAVADVERRLQGGGPADAADKDDSPPAPADENGADENGADEDVVEALIGHLLLVGHQDTDLADKLGLDGRFGAHGIRVPVRGPDLPDADALLAGRLEHRFAVDYAPLPGTPKLIPMRVDVRMSDPDNADVDEDLLKAITGKDTERLALDADAIKKFVGFKPYLRDLGHRRLRHRHDGGGLVASAHRRDRAPSAQARAACVGRGRVLGRLADRQRPRAAGAARTARSPSLRNDHSPCCWRCAPALRIMRFWHTRQAAATRGGPTPPPTPWTRGSRTHRLRSG